MELSSCVGGCVPLFLVAVSLDVLGLVLLFVGIFANVRADGRFYGDFLIYSGALVVFLSLACWLMWYVGNIPVPEDGGGARKRSSIVRLARKLSERLSSGMKGANGQVSSPARAASRVTWGRSAVYNNEGYDGSLDPPEEEEKKEQQ